MLWYQRMKNKNNFETSNALCGNQKTQYRSVLICCSRKYVEMVYNLLKVALIQIWWNCVQFFDNNCLYFDFEFKKGPFNELKSETWHAYPIINVVYDRWIKNGQVPQWLVSTDDGSRDSFLIHIGLNMRSWRLCVKRKLPIFSIVPNNIIANESNSRVSLRRSLFQCFLHIQSVTYNGFGYYILYWVVLSYICHYALAFAIHRYKVILNKMVLKVFENKVS